MMTSSNGNIFRVTGPLCGEFTGPGEFPAQRPVTRSFDVFFDLRLNKRLSKQPWGWWFETLSWSLWRHRNAKVVTGCDGYTSLMTSYPFWHWSRRSVPLQWLLMPWFIRRQGINSQIIDHVRNTAPFLVSPGVAIHILSSSTIGT